MDIAGLEKFEKFSLVQPEAGVMGHGRQELNMTLGGSPGPVYTVPTPFPTSTKPLLCSFRTCSPAKLTAVHPRECVGTQNSTPARPVWYV